MKTATTAKLPFAPTGNTIADIHLMAAEGCPFRAYELLLTMKREETVTAQQADEAEAALEVLMSEANERDGVEG